MSLTKKLLPAIVLVTLIPLAATVWVSGRAFAGVQPQVGSQSEEAVLVLVTTFIGAASVGLWVRRRLAQRVSELTKGAKTLAAGRFETRIVVNTQDELGTLARAFNQMAEMVEATLQPLQREVAEGTEAQEALARANLALEQRVEERTAELVREINDRKQAEEAARESETHLNAYFNAFPVGMFMVDREFRLLKVNPGMAERTGVPIEQHLGKTIREIVPQLADILEPLHLEVFATGKPANVPRWSSIMRECRPDQQIARRAICWQTSAMRSGRP